MSMFVLINYSNSEKNLEIGAKSLLVSIRIFLAIGIKTESHNVH